MVASGFDSAESVAELDRFRENIEATNWVMASGAREMFRDLGVPRQVTKIIVNASGVRVFREGYGDMDQEGW